MKTLPLIIAVNATHDNCGGADDGTAFLFVLLSLFGVAFAMWLSNKLGG